MAENYNWIKSKIKVSLGVFIWLLNFFIPKNKQYMIFYSEPQYSGNSKAVFEKLFNLNYNEKYIFIWAVKDVEKYVDVDINATFVKHKSLKGFWYFARSKYIFTTHSFWVNKCIKNRQILINLWHGMPLKKIGLLEEGMKKNPFKNYDVMPVTSDLFRIIMSKCFGSDLNNNYILGLPRNDYLYTGKEILTKLGIKNNYNKILLWMPTFRASGHKRVDGIESDSGLPVLKASEFTTLNSYLEKMNMMLILKLHPYQQKQYEETNLNNIFLLKDSQIPIQYNLYNIVGACDCLLTDYSSVYIDYLNLNKPIGFICDDIEKYSETRGFIFDDIKEFMPGEHITSLNELIIFLNDLHKGNDYYTGERVRVNQIFNKYQDGNNCLRLINKLEKQYFK